jgi:hypothetical protein
MRVERDTCFDPRQLNEPHACPGRCACYVNHFCRPGCACNHCHHADRLGHLRRIEEATYRPHPGRAALDEGA